MSFQCFCVEEIWMALTRLAGPSQKSKDLELNRKTNKQTKHSSKHENFLRKYTTPILVILLVYFWSKVHI